MKKLAIITGVVTFFFNAQPNAQTFDLVKDINLSGNGEPTQFVEYSGSIFFSADDGVNGRELWVSDGTTSGTQLKAKCILELKTV